MQELLQKERACADGLQERVARLEAALAAAGMSGVPGQEETGPGRLGVSGEPFRAEDDGSVARPAAVVTLRDVFDEEIPSRDAQFCSEVVDTAPLPGSGPSGAGAAVRWSCLPDQVATGCRCERV